MNSFPDRVRPALLAWYRRNGRDLPWRRTRDPYAVWISEIMLQQTRVAAVLEYYDSFLERFPDVATLAAASEDEVLGRWSGLGYYRRARSLHAGARAVMERHRGQVPPDPDALRELPGIGRYTAGAIASIAFDLAEPVVDGNVRRVLTRILGRRPGVHAAAEEERFLWNAATELVRGRSPGDLNQALMELGALVCLPRNPACHRCPVAAHCLARESGDPGAYHPERKTKPVTDVPGAVAWVERAGRFLLERPGERSPLRGVWDLPATETADGEDAGEAVRRALQDRHGIEIRPGEPSEPMAHAVMNRRLLLRIVPCRPVRGKVAGRREIRWAGVEELPGVPVSGATRKVLRRIGRL